MNIALGLAVLLLVLVLVLIWRLADAGERIRELEDIAFGRRSADHYLSRKPR